MVHHNILTLSPYTLFLSPHPSPTPSFIASPSSPYSFCSIDDVIVYGRNELWVIKKHMVKCRVESVVCAFILVKSGCFTDRETLHLPSLLHCLTLPYSFLHCLTLLPLLLSSLLHCLTLPLLLPSLPHPPPLCSFLHCHILLPLLLSSLPHCLTLPLLFPSLPHPPPLLLSSLPHPPPLLLPLLLHPLPTPSFIASPSSFLHYFINSPSSPYSFLYFLPLPLLLPSLPHPPPPSPFFIASLILEPA